jgi:hypothetical protein
LESRPQLAKRICASITNLKPRRNPMAEAESSPFQPINDAIEALDLAPVAKAAAYELKRLHPRVVFTSGRGDKAGQARAMASNVVKNRKWIVQTYKASDACAACQKWVDDHPEATTQAQIQDGLLSVFNRLADNQLGVLSKHLSGNAFDVQPVDQGAEAIKASIRGLKGLDLFLDREGGLTRWHAQFR